MALYISENFPLFYTTFDTISATGPVSKVTREFYPKAYLQQYTSFIISHAQPSTHNELAPVENVKLGNAVKMGKKKKMSLQDHHCTEVNLQLNYMQLYSVKCSVEKPFLILTHLWFFLPPVFIQKPSLMVQQVHQLATALTCRQQVMVRSSTGNGKQPHPHATSSAPSGTTLAGRAVVGGTQRGLEAGRLFINICYIFLTPILKQKWKIK